jgi:virginiamycin B lyase
MSNFLLRFVALTLITQSPAALAQGEPALPDGPHKKLIELACLQCHRANTILRTAGYDKHGWHHLIDAMIDLPEPLASRAINYMATNFPETKDRRPVLVPGDIEISIKEWTVPTLGQRPRDPLQMRDGTIWWAGMWGSLIGRLDPETGEMKEFRLDPEARPHSVINDPEGNIWYTGNGNGTVGMLSPETGEIKVYPMPDPAARDPHTPIFTRDGALWFTLQNSNMLGRLVPDSGEIRLIALPTEDARPYGIKADSKDSLWIAYRGANKIANVDPKTWEVREYPTPAPDPDSNPSTYIRRLALTDDDIVWYVDSGRGYLGRLDPGTGEIREWPSPSGPESHPYAIEVIDGIIWYNESNQRPDALVRFDPATQKFQSWTIPSGVGIIRHMRATPDGNLVIHQSSTNTVGLVTIGAD